VKAKLLGQPYRLAVKPLSFLAVVLILAVSALAQSPNGTNSGLVLDPTGAVIRRVIRKTQPRFIVNAAAYAAVDQAEMPMVTGLLEC
jgi:hypothetical protein